MNYKVGVVQFEPRLFEVDKNLKKMAKLVETVEADLVVFPELATSGYIFNSVSELKKVAENSQNGATANMFKKLAEKNNTSYVVGFVELSNGKIFNSSMLVNPNGNIFIYRKTHLFFEEKKWFTAGNSGFKVFKAKYDVKIGMMICFDWIFPESARSLALNGAQIITHSANLVLPWCQQAMITRSLENHVFSITSNRIGKEINNKKELTFTGMSQILGTKGEILHRMDRTEESVFVTSIDPNIANDKMITEYNHAFSDRKTEFYNL